MEEAFDDAELDRFFAAAGRCIVGWSFIDRVLYDVFETALGAEPAKASIIYYRSPSLSDHLVLTDKIVGVTLKGTAEHKAWNDLKKRVEKLSPVRNKVAHHPITQFWVSSASGDQEWFAYVEEVRKRPHLEPAEHFNRALESQIDLAALARHHADTVDLHRDLLAFLEGSADALRGPAPTPT